MIELDRCYIGDCRETLAHFIASGVKVQTVVTSPPYWGLRDYGIEPTIWGGEAMCSHVWGDALAVHKGGSVGSSSGLTNRGAHQARNAVKHFRAGQFCRDCGAWLGCLGLEPDYRLFVQHMVHVFALVREVLADDGTLWLNLGDSYATSGGSRFAGGASRERHPPPGTMKAKELMGLPWRVAFALSDAGWWLRQDIIWAKKNPMPESVRDRCTKSHEYLFLLSKARRYYSDFEAIKEPSSPDTHPRYARGRSDTHKYADGGPDDQTIAKSFEHMRKKVAGWADGPGSHGPIEHAREKGPKDEGLADQGLRDSTKFGRGAGWRERKLEAPGSGTKANTSFDAAMRDMPAMRNKRSVWTITSEPYSGAHFATFPQELVEPCVLAGSRAGDVVLDPFFGSGTVGQVAQRLGRRWLGCELKPEYVNMQAERIGPQKGLEL